MRRPASTIVLPLLLCAALAAPLPAQKDVKVQKDVRAQKDVKEGTALTVLPQGELDIVKVLVAQERAWNDGNMTEFLSGYKHSPQTTFVSGSVQHGAEEMASHYRATYPSREAMGLLSFSDLEPRLLDEHFALLTGKYHLERSKKAGGNAQGIFSLVFEKTPDGWKIILDHTS